MRFYDSLRVFILRLDGTVDSLKVPPMWLSEKSTLEDIRHNLVSGPLGTTDHDIFFPNWTKSIHVIKDSGDLQLNPDNHEQVNSKKYDITTSEELQAMLDEEHATPGTYIIILQQCRSKRYSRKPDNLNMNMNMNGVKCYGNAGTNSTTTPTSSSATNSPTQTSATQLDSGSPSSPSKHSMFTLPTRANHHHHHHHYPATHNRNSIAKSIHNNVMGAANSSKSISPFLKRNYFRQNQIEHNSNLPNYQFPIPPPSLASLHPPPHPPQTPHQAFIPPSPAFDSTATTSTEQTFLFYPDPLMSYGMLPAPLPSSTHNPHMFPQVYAVPWNVGCYIPAGSVPPTWFIA